MADGEALSVNADPVGALLRGLTGAAPIETHISQVFVGPDAAFKRRKPVRLTFLDFSDPEARRRYGAREIALNAPHAPGLYRGLRAVTQAADGTLALDGEGQAIDWVVEMAPLPHSAFLDHVAQAGGLDEAMLDAIADAVAAMHQALPPGGTSDLQAVARNNFLAAKAAGLDPVRAAAWLEKCLAALAARAPALAGRAAAGCVRRCHGDLHLGNLVLMDGAPVPFDALEFDEALATVDTGYDLAFLLMDLDQRVSRAAANRVLNRYVARTGDAGLVAGLPPWLSLRALIRAHVAAKRGDGAEAEEYLAAALSYLAPPPPALVAVGGLQGTGKSTLARALAPSLGAAPGALVLRSDEIRKRLAGLAPEDRLPREAYTWAAGSAVYAAVERDAALALAAGHAVIADAMFQAPAERAAIAAAAGKTPFVGLWLEAPLSVLEARLAARTGDASDADAAVLRASAARKPGPLDWQRIDATDADAALALAQGALAAAGVPSCQSRDPPPPDRL